MNNYAILCVDDDPVVLFSLKIELKTRFLNKFTYETAEDALSALETIKLLKEDGVKILLVISDWMMPGMKGDEFLAVVKKNYPSIKAIMLTGLVDEESRERVLREKLAEKIITKPWKSEELLDLIDKICREIEESEKES